MSASFCRPTAANWLLDGTQGLVGLLAMLLPARAHVVRVSLQLLHDGQ